MEEFTAWLKEILLYVPKKVWEWITDSIASAIEAIPVPDWMTNAGTSMSDIPTGVIWFANMVQLPAGIGIILAAYGIRFIIRRIPIIG